MEAKVKVVKVGREDDQIGVEAEGVREVEDIKHGNQEQEIGSDNEEADGYVFGLGGNDV